MWTAMIDSLSSAYIQLGIFVLLFALFLHYRRRYGELSTALTWLRTTLLTLIFLYLLWNWSGLVNPSLQAAAVFLMFIINLAMVHNIVTIRLENTYRQALETFALQPHEQALHRTVWHTGRSYYQSRYLVQSLVSGKSPKHFLHLISSEEIPKDIQQVMAEHGVEKQKLVAPVLVAFLKDRLAHEGYLPPEVKQVLGETIDSLVKHAWLAEQIGAFLQLAGQDPEQLFAFTEAAGPESKTSS